jgi:hypothetical protein
MLAVVSKFLVIAAFSSFVALLSVPMTRLRGLCPPPQFVCNFRFVFSYVMRSLLAYWAALPVIERLFLPVCCRLFLFAFWR